jgi:SH3 domain-containing YSC84-like protein 1
LDDNAELYGKKLENREIVTKGVRAPLGAEKLMAELNHHSLHQNAEASKDSDSRSREKKD